jgi:hypothetical protein
MLKKTVLHARNHRGKPVKQVSVQKVTRPPIVLDEPEYSDPGEVDEINPPHIPDLDVKNIRRLEQVSHYAEEITLLDQTTEMTILLSPDSLSHMQQETGITPRNRATVVNWLIRVHSEWQMMNSTLFNAVFCFDVALSRIPIPKPELQLLGVVCFWMCSKLSELHYPSITDFRTQCRVPYTRQMFVDCERRLLAVLGLPLEYPTAESFLNRFLSAIHASDTLTRLSLFACEVSLLYFEFNQFRRSATAFASILIGAAVCGELPLIAIPILVRYSHFEDLATVFECARSLAPAVDAVLSARNSPTYSRWIAPFESRTRPACAALDDIRLLLLS